MIVGRALALVAILLAILPVSGAFAEGGADLRGADTYVVQPGDTLYNISTRTGVSVDTLVRVNHLTDADTIFVGSVLRLRDQSGQNGSTVTTTVRSTQALAAALPGSVVAASVSTQAQVQAQMQAAGPAPSYAIAIPLAVGNPTNFGVMPQRGPMAPSLQGAAANATVLNANARPPDSPSLLPGASPALSVQIASQYMGMPYEYGGADPTGFDCSGFVYFVLSRAGRSVPRDLFGQYNAGVHPQSLEPGDLVFFQDTYEAGLSHVGIYVGNGKFIHAVDETRGVGISSLNEDFYSAHWYGATRIP